MADTYVYLIRNESNACIFVRNLETVETNQHDVYLGPGAEARYYDDNRPGIPMAKSASEFERHRLVIKKESVSYNIYELDGRVRFTTGGWSKDGSLLPGYSGPGAIALIIDREGNLKGEFHSYVGNRPLGSVNWAPLSIALYGVDARNNVIEKSWTAVKGWGPWSSIGAPDAVTLSHRGDLEPHHLWCGRPGDERQGLREPLGLSDADGLDGPGLSQGHPPGFSGRRFLDAHQIRPLCCGCRRADVSNVV